MGVGQVSYNDDKLSLLQIALDKFPAGMLILEGGTILLANAAAIRALEPASAAAGQQLALDGPDGALADRIASAAKNKNNSAFDYHLDGGQPGRTLRLDVVPLSGSRALARIDDITSLQRGAARSEQAIRHAFHEFKTPLAVLSLGLSNLSVYYDRLPDEERKAMIDDLAQQVREMSTIVSDLYEEIRSGHSQSAPDEEGSAQASQ